MFIKNLNEYWRWFNFFLIKIMKADDWKLHDLFKFIQFIQFIKIILLNQAYRYLH